MFETAELGRTVSKEDYAKRVPDLRMELLRVQNELKAAPFAVIIVIGGVDGAGKGETVNLLHEWMDPRYLETHAFGPKSDEEAERPPFWRFWRALPPKGRIGILFGSWYTDPIVNRVYGLTKTSELDAGLRRINTFERALVDDGTLIVKFWFHLSEEAQRKRLKSLEKDPKTRWRVTETDWKHFKLYGKFRRFSERALRETSTGSAPWIVIEGADHRYRSMTVGEHLLDVIGKRLKGAAERRSHAAPRSPTKAPDPKTILDMLDVTKTVAPKRYDSELEEYQGRLNELSRKAKKRGLSTIIVSEGWDAAGKGGLVRRITAALDARNYRVIPIAAPSDEEKAHHYLWRFWRHIPRTGRFTIYDRSWYGRVLVERVEGYAPEADWMRAYAEINDFEEQLAEHGVVLVKWWVHISKAEQLKRFKAREETSYKQFKITEEDYRNREKWNAYEAAANEMFERTSTEYAPWTLIEGNDKHFARLKGLKTVVKRLEGVL
jgi:polyphosphate:AMP phosphotransferase